MLIKQAVDEFKERLKALYTQRLKELVIYGSCARGDATDKSDIDLLVVLKGKVFPGEEIDRMIDAITEVNLKYGVLLSVYPVSEKDFENLNSPLLINVRREGVRA
ncbi:nucleotidyltransferase domain-containing protein [candidate division WOR-3 bacterium]|uniref:Nucleotidyltransferase domain-containing protein n=1 Tax=candidate division WOR-3 bacterium TaxID=2052148 RepID=A0A9D5KAI5_UNCW3|nr:nucleotidyltransferase domain-containing protein [candidate division WOR-3 bacterium]MBD3365318.1 nucleotidyltransferase domain-containing protein [candidate division WOR-3 bacterium]